MRSDDRVIAALYVEPAGPYAGLDGVYVWDEARDARTYAGPHPVVAHPPCGRWSMFANVNKSRYGTPIGSDGGCFAAALAAVRNHGGVLEHPAFSMAWRWFHLCQPPTGGGWVWADWLGGWTCQVDQGNYGHQVRKLTWLYAVGVDLPSLTWGDSGQPVGLWKMPSPGHGRYHAGRMGTPEPFRNLLLSMARSVYVVRGL